MKNVLFEHKKIINRMPHKRLLRIYKKKPTDQQAEQTTGDH
jgi:hypothetical protein